MKQEWHSVWEAFGYVDSMLQKLARTFYNSTCLRCKSTQICNQPITSHVNYPDFSYHQLTDHELTSPDFCQNLHMATTYMQSYISGMLQRHIRVIWSCQGHFGLVVFHQNTNHCSPILTCQIPTCKAQFHSCYL